MLRPLPATRFLPNALYQAGQVRGFERRAIQDYGIAGATLMERAGEFAFRMLRERWPRSYRVTVFAGPGNNGGDGYVLALLARAQGLSVQVLTLGDPPPASSDAALWRRRYLEAGGRTEPFQSLPRRADVIVDAILGIGLNRPLTGLWSRAVVTINDQTTPVLAIDIPTGLDADRGCILGAAVRAQATVTFVGLKQGLFLGAGVACRGDLYFAPLGVPSIAYDGTILNLRRIDWQSQSEQVAPRDRTAHKGHFGHVLIVGGGPGMPGAARLAGEAALRAGAGLVTVATHPAHAPWLNLTRPELMVVPVATPEDLDPLLERADVVAIGPGLGRDPWAVALWERVRLAPRRLVVDADALNLLAADPMRRDHWILTPHPGEATRLLRQTVHDIETDRLAAVQALQNAYGGVAVLKGAGTLIAGAGPRRPAVCSDGNPGMATAGMGDALTGVIAALLAQGVELELAATQGVCVHAAAGDAAAAESGERGLIASDLIAWVRPVLNGLTLTERKPTVVMTMSNGTSEI